MPTQCILFLYYLLGHYKYQLSLPLWRDLRCVYAQALSFWIKNVIKDAYEQLPLSASPWFEDEARIVAASQAFHWNVVLVNIMTSVARHSDSTFGAFY